MATSGCGWHSTRVSAALRELVEGLQVTDAYDFAVVPATSKEGAGDEP